MRFDILNHLGVAHDCDGQTDRQIDGRTRRLAAFSIARSNIVRYALKTG